MKLAIIDYGAGNLFSVAGACRKLGYDPVVTASSDIITGSDKIIFPGVGNAVSAMSMLKERDLDMIIPSLSQPVLGICLGMQLMFERSDEGDTRCLGLLEGGVDAFGNREGEYIKIPHMGWNIIDEPRGKLFAGIPGGSYMYFVHSYYVPGSEHTVAYSYYNGRFTAAIEKDNFFGCQFHPEKSGDKGIKILKNFLEL